MKSEIPKYNELYREFLEIISDGKEHSVQEIRSIIAKKRNISPEALNILLDSGHNLFNNRVGWTATYLKKAGLIESHSRGFFNITDSGLAVLNTNEVVNNEFLMNYESFSYFKKGSLEEKDITNVEIEEQQTPQELIEIAIDELNNALSEQLLFEILKKDSDFFEELSVRLINAMGYGKKENSYVTQRCRDKGIDGIVLDDELGINNILIQAKRYNFDYAVSRPEVQKFWGALYAQKNVKKGVFITTSRFTSDAIEYADSVGLILIDGKKLTTLMIKYNVGCGIQNVYEIKTLDIDFFEGD